MLPWWLLMVGLTHHSRSCVDPSDHWIKHARTRSIGFLPREGCRSRPSTTHKINLRWHGERKEGLQGSLHTKWWNAPTLWIDSRKSCQEEYTNVGHRFCDRPHRKMCWRKTNELGELQRQPVGERLSWSARPGLRVSLQLVVDYHCLHHLGDFGGRKLPWSRVIRTTIHEFQYPLVFEWHGEAVEVKCDVPHLLLAAEESHWILPSHEAEYTS